MNEMKIACDFDGVLCRTMDKVCEFVNKKRGTNLTYKDITGWSWLQDNGFHDEFWEKYDLFDKEGRLELEPYDQDTISVLNDLATRHEVEVLTCNDPSATQGIEAWLVKWGGPKVKVNCIGRKGGHDKLALDYEFYLDDNPGMAEAIKDFPGKTQILLQAPWNRNTKETEQVKRVKGWKEIKELL